MLYLCIKIHCHVIRRKENRKSVRNHSTLHNRAAHRRHFARLRYGQAVCYIRKGNTTIRYPTSGKGYSFSIITPKFYAPLLNITGRVLFFHSYPLYLHRCLSDRKDCDVFLSIPPHCEMRRVFLSLHKTSDKEYGTSKPPTTLHYLRCRNTRHDDSHLGSTRNYLVLQTQRIQVPNEGRS